MASVDDVLAGLEAEFGQVTGGAAGSQSQGVVGIGGSTTGAAPPVAQRPTTLARKLIIIADNERHAPEILPYPGAVINNALSRIASQKETIASLTSARQQAEAAGLRQSSVLPFNAEDLYRLELSRLLFLVQHVLKLRLQKIHRFAAAIVARPEEFEGRLTANELMVARRLHEIAHAAALEGGLRLLPPELQSLTPVATSTSTPAVGVAGARNVAEGDECLPRARKEEYVFVVALEPISVTVPGVDEALTCAPGQIWVVRYEHVKSHVVNGTARLI